MVVRDLLLLFFFFSVKTIEDCRNYLSLVFYVYGNLNDIVPEFMQVHLLTIKTISSSTMLLLQSLIFCFMKNRLLLKGKEGLANETSILSSYWLYINIEVMTLRLHILL